MYSYSYILYGTNGQCTYRLLTDQAAPSYVQRAALHAWGGHSKGPVRLEYPSPTGREGICQLPFVPGFRIPGRYS